MKPADGVFLLFWLLADVSYGQPLEEAILEPSQDNTLYETPMDTEELVLERSNGAGSFLFAGRTGFDAGFRLRRTALKFDLTVLPPGSKIISASLTLFQSRAAPGSPPVVMSLHRLLQDWGEGDSDAVGPEGQGTFPAEGDATWFRRFYPDQDWDTAGGSFDASPAAMVTVGDSNGYFTWECTATMVTDLRGWLESPESNFGWILMGGEIAGQSAHRFNSRDNSTPEERPKLTVLYRNGDFVSADGFESMDGCGNLVGAEGDSQPD